MKRRGDQSLGQFLWHNCTELLAFTYAAAVVVFVIATLAFWAVQTDRGGNYRDHREVAAMLNRLPPSERVEFAHRILELDSLSLNDSGGASGLDPGARKVIERVAETGEIPPPNDNRWYWRDFWSDWVWGYLPLLIILTFAMPCVQFLAKSAGEDKRVADLPFNTRVWPWLFVLLTLVLLLPFYLWSGVMLQLQRRAERQEQELALQAAEQAAAAAGQNKPNEGVQEEPRFDFTPAPDAARALYDTARWAGSTRSFRTRVAELEGNESYLVAELQRTAQLIRENQAKLGTTRSDLVAAQANLLRAQDETALTDETLAVEFDRLTRLKGVKGVGALGPKLVLLVHNTFTHQGKTYDLGDWIVNLDTEEHSCSAENIRSTALTDRPSPTYLHNFFCFGGRRAQISTHLQRGEVLEAASLTIGTIGTPNEGDVHKVTSGFPVIKHG